MTSAEENHTQKCTKTISKLHCMELLNYAQFTFNCPSGYKTVIKNDLL